MAPLSCTSRILQSHGDHSYAANQMSDGRSPESRRDFSGVSRHRVRTKQRDDHASGTLSHGGPAKIVDYLLDRSHPGNNGKADFFEALGFSRSNPHSMEAALQTIGRTGEVVEAKWSIHGEKYVVDGSIAPQTESGHRRMVRTVWIISRGALEPRLITAYPGKE
jgi:hypothetical protein